MLHVDIPTLPELQALATERGPAHVSIFLSTTPLTQDAEADRIAFRNLADRAIAMLEEAPDAETRAARLIRESLAEQFGDILADDAFWRVQAHGLAVLATPERTRTWRLANRLSESLEVSDRFRLTPLLRAQTFPQEAFVLVLPQEGPRLLEFCAELPAGEVRVPGLPASAAAAAGRAAYSRSPRGRLHGSEGQKVILRAYARRVDEALRPVLAGRSVPLILAATEPMNAIFRSVCSYPHLLPASPDGLEPTTPDPAIGAAARAVLDAHNAAGLAEMQALIAQRAWAGRATSDLAGAARAATLGGIDTLLVDMDAQIPGTIHETDGAVAFAETAGADSHDLLDEIACRALLTGARVLSVRAADIPDGKPLAAALRWPL